jgi:hypothetical protein
LFIQAQLSPECSVGKGGIVDTTFWSD